MAHTMTRTMTRGEVQDLVSKFTLDNPAYRAAFIRDPKGMIERQFGTSLGEYEVRTVLDTPGTVHVVLPHVPAQGELQDCEVESVAGGKGDPNINASCYTLGGTFNTVNQVLV